MSRMAPEQYRELAELLDRCADNDRNAVRVPLLHESADALRTAADQLEAVRVARREVPFNRGNGLPPLMDVIYNAAVLDAILTAETAPSTIRDVTPPESPNAN